MPLTLALKKGAKVIHLTYDGQSLHIEGDEMDKKASSSRSCLSFGQTSEKNGGITIDKLYLLHITHLHRTNMVQIRALVHRDSKNKNARLEPYKFLYSANEGDQDTAVQFCNQVMDDVYKGLQPEKRLKVLINPFGGQGLAKQTFESHVRPVFEAAGCQLSVQYTESQGHAVQIAKDLDIDAFDAIVTVSGDGVIHEVINGFLERPDAAQAIQSVPLGVIPGGTGNALSICLAGEQLGFNPAYTALQVVKGTRMPLDLCSVTYGHRRYFSFLSHNYGITSYADLATEHLRWMGDARTVLGLMQEIFARHTYPMEAAVQIVESDKEKIKKAYRASRTAATSDTPDHVDKHTHSTIPSLSEPVPSDWTIIKDDVAFFLTSKVPWLARGMLSHPCALPNDGLLDLLLVRGRPGVMKQLGIFAKVEKGNHIDTDIVEYYKIKAFRLTPIKQRDRKGYIAIDGEHAPAEPFQVEVHPHLGSVLSLQQVYVHTGI